MRGAELGELKPEQIALFLDVDGTLLDLAPRPDAVEVSAALIDGLGAAADRLDGALALISGRAIGELDRLFSPLRLRAAGVHGAELRLSANGAAGHDVLPPLPDGLWRELRRLLDRFPGTFAENKRSGFAVHYRFAPTVELELAGALSQLAARFPQHRLMVMNGRKVFEIKQPGADKGEAIGRFMASVPFSHRVPVFIADDPVIDRSGFETALALGGMGFSVGVELPGLTGCFAEPAAVRAWIGRLGETVVR
jgi:trehalose 6-phosphate phosphatase